MYTIQSGTPRGLPDYGAHVIESTLPEKKIKERSCGGGNGITGILAAGGMTAFGCENQRLVSISLRHSRSHTSAGQCRAFRPHGGPTISVPCGKIDGLPIGMQIVGRIGDDATVLCPGHA